MNSQIDRFLTAQAGWRDHVPTGLVVLATLIACWLMWLVAHSLVLLAAFAGAGLITASAIYAIGSNSKPRLATVFESQDWSLVREVADSEHVSMAITDRTGRLVCANDLYCAWFGGASTPPNLPVDAQTSALLSEVGRSAWRDGEAAISGFLCNERELSGSVHRVGRNADHLLWRWQAREAADPVAEVMAQLEAAPGRILGQSGVMAALVTSAGTVQASNDAFRLRAAGSADARVDGRDFAQLLRLDTNGLIRFERERDEARSTPLRIIELPFDVLNPAAPMVLLLIDEDGGAATRGIALNYVESLLTALPLGMAMVDRDGRFLFINAAFTQQAGLDPAHLPSYPGDLVVAEDKAPLAEAVRRHAGGRSSAGDLAVRFAAQPNDNISIGIVGVRGMGEAAVLLAIKDSAGDSDLRQQMVQATKMQAVGQLAGGIAHDFNNILTAMLGVCDLMLLRHSPGDSDYDDIQGMRSNANRAANLTRQLLAFSRQQTLRPQILNLSDIVADVSHLLHRLIGEGVTLDVQHGRGLGPVRADPVQLEQVIVNLAVNARDAMASGGTLTIATRAITNAQSRTLALEGMPPGDYSLLSVGDSGTGIAADVLPKIFDPFFTTKDLGKGTGLGLATVYGIVKQSGGYIFAESAIGKGTTFSIYLPVYSGLEQAESAAPAPAAARSMHWGNGTILLVEDEEMVRAVAQRALTRAGYSVVTANHGEDGLEKYASMAEVDLIITDVMMPNMDGPTMVAEIRAHRSDGRAGLPVGKANENVPVLFMSGYAEEQLRESIALSNVAFIPKPFSVAQLIEAVAAIRGIGNE
ncbi:MAG: ATP-binding protein [Sphingopyxis sp.]